jgi:hypothetical protein
VRRVTAPKIATLALLAAAGVPVPAFVALPEPREPADWSEIDELLRGGPVIVRAALLGEDLPDSSGAGLGSSVAGCRDRDAVRAALAHITAALADDPWLATYFSGPPRAQVLVQREITGPWLAVVAQTQLRHVELHRRDPALADPLDLNRSEPLAAGLSPALAGPLDLFPPELRAPITCLCDQVTAALPPAPHGLDLELVADLHDRVWVVQARPLTRPLHPGWPAFAAAARLDLLPSPATPALPLPGLWILDGEHNPAPLSRAHAGLIRRLAGREAPRMRVLAGWLYNASHLPHARPEPTEPVLRAALHALQHHHIPTARAALAGFDREPDPDLVDRACDHLQHILAIYAALPERSPRLTADPCHPLSLQARGEHLDVLPAVWDIASPTLLDLSFGTALPAIDFSEPAPDQLGTSLGELDDHLFALGLAPLRRVYLRSARRLQISAEDIFLLTPDELQAALRGASHDLAVRRAEQRAQAELYPPLQLFDGWPVPAHGDAWLRGVPIGPVAEGPLHLRRDLAELLADPLPPGAILAIPALTAQAAVVLRALAVRAVCCEHGGAMSHAALMARELGLSALIGCRGCTTLAPGSRVRLDTRTGRLRPLPPDLRDAGPPVGHAT